MRAELLDTVSECFLTSLPLIKKKLFRSISLDNIPFQLSRSNLEVLLTLFELRSASVSELCNQLRISRPNMTPLIDKLVRHELAERTTSTEDRRVVRIALTANGERLCQELRKSLTERIRIKLGSLEDEDLLELKKCMGTLQSIASKIQE
ncbi:MarR family winged helix-turn-helix transcriptional regulator [Cohnella mopanensis]|uniref:MarR family winged helix-turn-helix transcriptional regulator n=1 Tax=Cohnella mopanensis TaxID=2911966 RepID=UPI001EF8FA9F|nr:MarR family transcriptional regulator [Cohnella mopanensis]